MDRGADSKAAATEMILKTSPGSFIYDKEIRIPYVENGENIQLKCTLTCAKTNVGEGDEDAIPGAAAANLNFESTAEPQKVEPTEEEKENVKKLMEVLGL